MGRYFDHTDVFPVVSKLIVSQNRSTKDFVPHDALVLAYLSDPQGKLLVKRASKKNPEWSKQHWAGIMIAWFSQRITVGTSEYGGQFTRTRIGRQWAYKPGKNRRQPART